MTFKLERVHFMPKDLEPGVLYFSNEFGTAAHLCPCGCGSKVRTPIGPTEWFIEESNEGPSLFPSIGNWQLPCRSHYWISKGKVDWSDQWTEEEISEGRRSESSRRRKHFENSRTRRNSIPQALAACFRWIFRRGRGS